MVYPVCRVIKSNQQIVKSVVACNIHRLFLNQIFIMQVANFEQSIF
jgi:hypothetical protein